MNGLRGSYKHITTTVAVRLPISASIAHRAVAASACSIFFLLSPAVEHIALTVRDSSARSDCRNIHDDRCLWRDSSRRVLPKCKRPSPLPLGGASYQGDHRAKGRDECRDPRLFCPRSEPAQGWVLQCGEGHDGLTPIAPTGLARALTARRFLREEDREAHSLACRGGSSCPGYLATGDRRHGHVRWTSRHWHSCAYWAGALGFWGGMVRANPWQSTLMQPLITLLSHK